MKDARKTWMLTIVATLALASSGAAQNTWIDQTSGAGIGGILNDVAFGNGHFVAVGTSNAIAVIASSQDGITWVNHTGSPSIGGSLNAVTFGNGRLVAVGGFSTAGVPGGGAGVFASSSNGTTWIPHPPASPIPGVYRGVAFGGGQFVAVGTQVGSGVFASSTTGASWVLHIQNPVIGGEFNAVAFGNGVFVAVGTLGGAPRIVMSPNGMSWIDQSANAPMGATLNGITFADGQFVAVGTTGATGVVFTSPDGVTWTNRPGGAGIGPILRSVAFDSGTFVAVGRTGAAGSIAVSSDAITWNTITPSPASGDLNGVANGNNTWVAVGSNMVAGVVVTSVGTPDLVLNPASLNFGTILNNGMSTLRVTLSNQGAGTVTVNSVGGLGVFTPIGFSQTPLGPGASMSFDIQFNPSGVSDNFSEDLPIARTPAVGASLIRCIGSARDPEPRLTITPLSLNFGRTNVRSTANRMFTVSSSGDIPVTVNSITAPGAPFTVIAPASIPTGAPIAVGTSGTFTVQFTPTATGLASATIVFASTDPVDPSQTVTLSGEGHVPSAEFVIDPTLTNLNYTEVQIGYRFGKAVQIWNNGDADLTFDVEVLGDMRFTFSTNPNVPGTGVRRLSIPIPGVPSPTGPFNSVILRVTFEATAPERTSPYTGTLRINNIMGDTTPPAQPVDISLSGEVITAKPVDIALVIDRSGSISDPMRVETKEEGVRSASRLFVELMRADVGDRLSLVQFDNIVDVFERLQDVTTANRQNFVLALDAPNLTPRGSTSIAGGLYEAFEELNDSAHSPFGDVRVAFVISDGQDNTPYQSPTGPVTLNTLQIPGRIIVHALALGTSANTDLGILSDISTRSGGMAHASDDVTRLGIFDIEKFFLQAATAILGGTMVRDPVDRIERGQRHTWQVELIAADKEVTFVLMFKEGALPFTVTAPDGTVYPVTSPPAGFGQALSDPPKARILKIQLPTHDPSLYIGTWQLSLFHGGKLTIGEGDDRSTIERIDPVDYALAVSVLSDLRILGIVSPQPLYTGDPITVTAFLTEEETAVTGATVDVEVRFPNGGSTRHLQLMDDGQHSDGASNDGEYAAVFTQTTQAGAYGFTYHAFGQSARAGNFVRETQLSQYVLTVGSTPEDETPPVDGEPGTGSFEKCCRHIIGWLIVIAILLLLMLLLCFRRNQLISPPGQVISTGQPPPSSPGS